MITIIFAHPWHGSFCKAVLDTITNKLAKDNRQYQVIDLNKDNFNPVLTESELALYSRGLFTDPLVEKKRKRIPYSFDSHDYGEGRTPEMREVSDGHFVMLSQTEYDKIKTGGSL